MSETVLLTGASGFVGRAVHAALLARGYRVEPVGRGMAADGHRADLLDAAERARVLAKTKAETLVHAAWFVEHGTFWHSPHNDIWRSASVEFARGFLKRGGKRIVAFGTCAEYSVTGPQGLWPETRRLSPATPYGQAKADLCADLSALCRAAGAGLLWLRLFHLYGQGEAPARFVPSLVGALREGRVAQVKAAGLVRDFASTRHIGMLVGELLGTSACGAMNLGSGSPRSLGDLARVLAEAAGRPGLLELGNAPAPTDPAVMAPDLSRLWQAIGQRVELPEVALREVFTYS